MSQRRKRDAKSCEISKPFEGTQRERAAIATSNGQTGPSLFTAELADQICNQLAGGMTLREICRAEAMPDERTVRAWALDDKEGFAEKYSRGREIGYHSMADEMLEIADDGSNDWMLRKEGGKELHVLNGEHIQRSRLRLDTRKWLLSKALPKIYGDKLPDSDTQPQMIVQLRDPIAER